MGRRLLRGDIRGEGRVWLKSPGRILAECRPGDQTSLGGRWQMRNLLTYPGGSAREDGEFISKLTSQDSC